MRDVLRDLPLPLALDFSAARLSGAQRRWLFNSAQAGRVEAAVFDHEDAQLKQPALDGFLARHGGMLLRLSCVPLQLILTYKSQEERLALDLSGLRLTGLGIACYIVAFAVVLRHSDHADIWLWPERLPGTLGSWTCSARTATGSRMWRGGRNRAQAWQGGCRGCAPSAWCA